MTIGALNDTFGYKGRSGDDRTAEVVAIAGFSPGASIPGLIGLRPLVVKGAITTAQTSYTTNQAVGGKVAIATGLPAGTVISSGSLRVKAAYASISTGSSLYVMFFDADPAASTVTDAATFSLNSADLSKAMAQASGNWVATSTTGMQVITLTVPKMTVDGSGNIYFALISPSGNSFSTINVLIYALEATY